MGIAGLVFGILSLILCWVPFVGPILGIIGIILSAVGMAKNNYKGCGIGGLVTAIIGLIIGIIVTVISLVAVAPQVVKWTDNSRRATDRESYNILVDTANLAMTDINAINELDNGDIIITMTESGVEVRQNGEKMSAQSNFIVTAEKFMPGFMETQLKGSYSKDPVITITKDPKGWAKVEKTVQPE